MTPAAVAGTVGEALAAATDALAAAGCESPRLDAELLLAEATGLGRAALASDSGREVRPSAGRLFGQMVRRRVAREPVAYILGRKGFRHIELAVDARVLIPRPETELLVELALELRPRTVLDIGTGSGAIALAIADELEDVAVTGVDTSAGAIEVARSNAERLQLDVHFRRVGAEPGHHRVERPVAGGWDLVLANLPYVADAEWDALAPEIRLHEPRDALVAGATGVEAIEALLGEIAVGRLAASAVALEVGDGQAEAVAELARRAGFELVEVRPDLGGIERVVLAQR